MFALDDSGSISRPDFERVVNFVRDLVSRMDVDSGNARVGVVTFSDEPELQFHLNRYSSTSEITRVISRIKYTTGKTFTHDALYYVKDEMFTEASGDRPDVDDILIIVTDGESENATLTVAAAREVRAEGIGVISLGIGEWVLEYELEGMASHPKVRNMFQVESYETLFTATDLLVETVCDGECVWNIRILILNFTNIYQ